MADEIPNANVIRLVKDGNRWCALIGPDPQQGLMGTGPDPLLALYMLISHPSISTWQFDDTWRPKD